MTVLNLEDSKALYEAGIKIEAKHYYGEDGTLHKLIFDRLWAKDIPAPDLEELLEYARKAVNDLGDRLYLQSKFYEDDDKTWRAMGYGFVSDSEEPIQALAKLLLTLKENGYEV